MLRHTTRRIDELVLGTVVGITLLTMLAGSACAAKHPVTQENSPEGRVAVYATKVVDGVRAVTDAVKDAESKQLVPTDAAATVVKAASEIDAKADQLGQLLQIYDAFSPQTPQGEVNAQLEKVREKLNEISLLVQELYVPAGGDPAAAKQIGELTGAVNQTLLQLALELAKGVR